MAARRATELLRRQEQARRQRSASARKVAAERRALLRKLGKLPIATQRAMADGG